MKSGQVIEKFKAKAKDGKEIEVVFRFPKESDLEVALEMVNFLRDEADYLGQRRHETMATERIWLAKRLEDMAQRKGFVIFVEANGELIGDASLQPSAFDASSHVGKIGIMLKEKYTGIGLGKKLFAKLLELAEKETDFKILESGFFSKNERSRKLHEKFGFKKYGELPNECRLKEGGYCSHISVYKQIKGL